MKQYNLYNLEASFIRFLNSGNRDLSKVTIKNYISDLRHFFGWFIFRLKASQEYEKFVEIYEINTLITKCFDPLIVNQYKAYLQENNISVQTANRRLSTLRKLAKFFISQLWIKSNPTSNLRNITTKKQTEQKKYYIQKESADIVMNEYKRALQSPIRQSDSEASQNLTSSEIDRMLKDVKEFMNFV